MDTLLELILRNPTQMGNGLMRLTLFLFFICIGFLLLIRGVLKKRLKTIKEHCSGSVENDELKIFFLKFEESILINYELDKGRFIENYIDKQKVIWNSGSIDLSLMKGFFSALKWSYHLNKFIKGTTAILVVIGVLGTFIGLAAGLQQISLTTTPENMVNEFQPLIDAMKTAFHTSIIAMISFIILSIILSIFKVDDKISEITNIIASNMDTDPKYTTKNTIEELGIQIVQVVAGEFRNAVTEMGDRIASELGNFTKMVSDDLPAITENLKLTSGNFLLLSQQIDRGVTSFRQMNDEVIKKYGEWSEITGQLKNSVDVFEGTAVRIEETNGEIANELKGFSEQLEAVVGSNSELAEINAGVVNEFEKIQVSSAQTSDAAEKLSERVMILLEIIEKNALVNEDTANNITELGNQIGNLLGGFNDSKLSIAVDSLNGFLDEFETNFSKMTEDVNRRMNEDLNKYLEKTVESFSEFVIAATRMVENTQAVREITGFGD